MKSPSKRVSEKERVNIPEIRHILGLNTYPFSDMDDDYIFLAFTTRKYENAAYKNRLEKKLGHSNYEMFEILGDTVLNMIVMEFLWDKLSGLPRINEAIISNVKDRLVSNMTLFCHMKNYGLCKYILAEGPNVKSCADVLEALIGILYNYLKRTVNIQFAMDTMTKWCTKYLHLERSFYNVYKGISKGRSTFGNPYEFEPCDQTSSVDCVDKCFYDDYLPDVVAEDEYISDDDIAMADI